MPAICSATFCSGRFATPFPAALPATLYVSIKIRSYLQSKKIAYHFGSLDPTPLHSSRLIVERYAKILIRYLSLSSLISATSSSKMICFKLMPLRSSNVGCWSVIFQFLLQVSTNNNSFIVVMIH